MNDANRQYLVETDWLEAHLDDTDLRILDCMVFVHVGQEGLSLESGRKVWSKGHIPGSGFADLVNDLSNPNHPVPLMMPPEEQFAEQMSICGVNEGTRVVLYDAEMNMWAARVWWLLRVFGFDNAAILNGGWKKWTLEERPISVDLPSFPKGNFETRPRPGLIATKEDVLAAIDDEDCRIVNALTAAEHQGKLAFYGRRGHIPTSVNVPARGIVDRKTHAYLPEEQLREVFTDAGATSGDRVITSCGGGIASSSDAFILTLLGVENVAVYDGSLLEWAPDLSLPMEM